MKAIIFTIKLCIVFLFTMQAQTPLQRLESVPEEFIKRYNQEYHEYNPLHVGDFWQFFNEWYGYFERKIVSDTTVLDKKYFKKLDFGYVYDPNYYYLERNDSVRRAAYRLDIQDLDEDGDSLDEVLLDSLEVPNWTEYTSYRYTWKPNDPDPKIALVYDSVWVIVFGDTVIGRIVEYIPPFSDELIADNYGMVEEYPEGSPPNILTGMIVNGVTYGNIVDINEANKTLLFEFRLENNFPNPFNPQTVIRYYIPEDSFIQLKVFDILGSEVKILVNEEMKIGFHEILFDGTGLPSGVYLYRLQTSKFSKTKKMILLR